MEVLYSEASQTVTSQKDSNEMIADVKTETMADSFSCQEDLNEMIAEIKAEKMAGLEKGVVNKSFGESK